MSYSSFEKLLKDAPYLENYLENSSEYLAHTHSEKAPETLVQHSKSVLGFAIELIKVHQLDITVNNLIAPLLNIEVFESPQKAGNHIKQLFLEAIIFHDYGKLNERFQWEKLSNELFKNQGRDIPIETQHSKLSTFLYLNYWFEKFYNEEDLNDRERIILIGMCFLFSNSILRHHSGTLTHGINLDAEIREGLKRFLPFLKIDLEEKISEHFFESVEEILDQKKEFLSDIDDYFPIYALLKLNFSLLTAADYLATNHYSLGIKPQKYGIIDHELKQKVSDKIRTTKAYNKGVFDNFTQIHNESFDNLQERNNKNLNKLRQKLSAEAIDSINKNLTKRLFYIEAPTGSGKTNLSILTATKLLEENPELDKVFYVFPFTTLVEQTFKSIKETLGLSDEELIKLHSKTGFHSSNETRQDGLYGGERLNYLDNLFVNYPFTLLTHIKFFDILKGNRKESNYLLHRLSNSIVIFDEIQAYPPKHWDKFIYFINNYARYFNIRFILMSATLPKIDELEERVKGGIVPLVKNRDSYFLNRNFSQRVEFDFSILENKPKPKDDSEKQAYLNDLAEFVFDKSETYAGVSFPKNRTV